MAMVNYTVCFMMVCERGYEFEVELIFEISSGQKIC